MIKESCNLIGREHILVYNFKYMYYVLCYEYVMCIELMVLVYLEINLSFVMNYLPRNDPRLQKGRLVSLSKSGRGWACLCIAAKIGSLTYTLSLVDISMQKLKKSIHYLQRY